MGTTKRAEITTGVSVIRGGVKQSEVAIDAVKQNPTLDRPILPRVAFSNRCRLGRVNRCVPRE
ncbi:MAG: hypothetical protein ACF8CQ_18990 [Rhodopirellula sp. JB044]|uniref:hypothetical protein n=1 Tax=Rhodopirellula sp. JB044 TaxID=3342844 RepID=UPI00370ABE0C